MLKYKYYKENVLVGYGSERLSNYYCVEITDVDKEMLNEKETVLTLRQKRENECFSVINRGEPWYKMLTEEQKNELQVWYQSWLDVTKTKEVPEKPRWLI